MPRIFTVSGPVSLELSTAVSSPSVIDTWNFRHRWNILSAIWIRAILTRFGHEMDWIGWDNCDLIL